MIRETNDLAIGVYRAGKYWNMRPCKKRHFLDVAANPYFHSGQYEAPLVKVIPGA